MSAFEEHVTMLSNKLLHEIAVASVDGDEYADGVALAATIVLDEGVILEVVEREDDLDDDLLNELDDEFDDYDDLTFDPWGLEEEEDEDE